MAGEISFAVRPLELPAADADEAGITAAESVQLFIARACDSAPGLVFDAQTVVLVGEICRRLDGIPLAIELAAARMKMLSATQLYALLNERFRLLTGGTRALPRQQTLQAVIQWSYEHLGAAEQRLLRALSVCGGGGDLAAAVALLGDTNSDMAVLDSLALLVDKSLLSVERQGQTARYAMLDTVRQYALERLGDSGEAAAVRDRHRDHFLALAEAIYRELPGGAPAGSLARLDRDRDNLYRALAWCDGAEGAPAGLRMVAALKNYWPSRGLLVRGYELTIDALARPGAQQRDPWRCAALAAATHLSCLMGRRQETCGHAEALLALAKAIGDDKHLAIALWHIAKIKCEQGEPDAGRRYGEESLAVARRAGDDAGVANALNGLAFQCEDAGEHDQAQALWEDALAACRNQTRGRVGTGNRHARRWRRSQRDQRPRMGAYVQDLL